MTARVIAALVVSVVASVTVFAGAQANAALSGEVSSMDAVTGSEALGTFTVTPCASMKDCTNRGPATDVACEADPSKGNQKFCNCKFGLTSMGRCAKKR
jgi:hypothetical protein